MTTPADRGAGFRARYKRMGDAELHALYSDGVVSEAEPHLRDEILSRGLQLPAPRQKCVEKSAPRLSQILAVLPAVLLEELGAAALLRAGKAAGRSAIAYARLHAPTFFHAGKKAVDFRSHAPKLHRAGISMSRRFTRIQKHRVAAVILGLIVTSVSSTPVVLRWWNYGLSGLDNPRLPGVFIYPTIGVSVAVCLIFTSLLIDRDNTRG